MATYKVIQDIEAEDKLIGPLSLRQFIYALIAVVCFYFCFLLITKGVAFLVPLFLLPGLLGLFFAVPWSQQQPTEVWALAKLRFMFKPRKRIWNQTGVKELVTITAPKKIERNLTNGLSQNDVESRLQALANTLDSRGWAVKNVNVSMSNTYGQATQSDRLVDVSNMPQEVPNYDISAADDMLDTQSNPVAQQFDTMIANETVNRRQRIMREMEVASHQPSQADAALANSQPANYWFMNNQTATPLQPGQAQFDATTPIVPAATYDEAQIVATPEEEAIIARARTADLQASQQTYGRLKTLRPIDDQPVYQPAVQPIPEVAIMPETAAPKPVTQVPNAAILNLATRNDLDVATIARQAKKAEQIDNDEVVISLR